MAFDSLDGPARPWRTGLLAAAASAGGVAIAGAGLVLPSESAQAVSTVATGTLVNLTTDSVPPLGLSGFHGTAATSGIASNGGDNAADSSQDPDGVLKHITVNGSAQSKTHADPVKNWAQAQMASAAASLPNGKQLYTVGSLDSYAECTSPPTGPSAQAYVHTDADPVKVLGTAIPAGKTTAVPVTGAQLGAAGVDHGSLRVTYTTTATPAAQTAGATAAHAHLDLTIAGTFYDAGGKEIFNGQLQKVRFGDVTATCENSAPTTPSSSSPLPVVSTTPTTPVSPTTSATSPINPNGPAAPTGTPAPTSPATEPTSPSGPAPAAADHTTAHPRRSKHHGGGSGGPSGPGNGPMQPAGQAAAPADSGGDPSGWWAAVSVIGLGGGAGLYLVSRRRGKHQH